MKNEGRYLLLRVLKLLFSGECHTEVALTSVIILFI